MSDLSVGRGVGRRRLGGLDRLHPRRGPCCGEKGREGGTIDQVSKLLLVA